MGKVKNEWLKFICQMLVAFIIFNTGGVFAQASVVGTNLPKYLNKKDVYSWCVYKYKDKAYAATDKYGDIVINADGSFKEKSIGIWNFKNDSYNTKLSGKNTVGKISGGVQYDLNTNTKTTIQSDSKLNKTLKDTIAKKYNLTSSKIQSYNIYLSDYGLNDWSRFNCYYQEGSNSYEISGYINISTKQIFSFKNYTEIIRENKDSLYIRDYNSNSIYEIKNGKVKTYKNDYKDNYDITMFNGCKSFIATNYKDTYVFSLKDNKYTKVLVDKETVLGSFDVDVNDKLWCIVQKNGKRYVAKYEDNKFVAKYEVNNDANGLSVYNDNSLIVTASGIDKNGRFAGWYTLINRKVAVKSIKLDKTSASVVKGKSITLKSTITPNLASNKNVTWKSSNTKIATVDKNGKVTAVAVGEATITATTKDGNKKATCKVKVTKPVEVKSIKLDRTSVTLEKGKNTTLKATISPNNASFKDVTWTSSNTKIATVDKNGKVTAVKPGTVTITAKTKSGSKTATSKVKIISSVTAVKLDKTSTSLTKGKTVTLKATITPSDATNKNVTWSSNNTKVATVDKNGKVTAVSLGEAVITVTTKDGNKKATCKVKVVKPVTGVKLDKTSTSLIKGKTVTLKATVNPSDATNKNVTWTSNNTKVATVDQTGKVTAVSAGEAVITVATKDGNKKATCTVKVVQPVTGVNLDQTTLILESSKTTTLKATINPSNATNKNVTWTSSDTNIATVDQTGKVTAIATGEAVITVTTKDGNKKATCKVNVIQPVTEVKLDKTTLTLENSKSIILKATINPSNATNKNVTWTSSDTNVATVDQTGKVTAVSLGEAIITVTTKDGSKKDTCQVTVVELITNLNEDENSIVLNTTEARIDNGESISLIATVSQSNETNNSLIWTSSDNTIATVNSDGVVTAIRPGKAIITVKLQEDSKEASCIININ